MILTLNRQDITDDELEIMVRNSACTKLILRYCPNITMIPDLPDNFTDLQVYRCSNLKYFGHMNLTRLMLSSCHSLEYIPNLGNLQTIYIVDCPLVTEFPNDLSSVKSVYFDESIGEIPYSMDPGFITRVDYDLLSTRKKF
jgi:hypothetical protein